MAQMIDRETEGCRWPDRLWVWHDREGRLQVTEGKPSRETSSREYGRFLSKQDLIKLARQKDGIDMGRYVNNLLWIIENQTREINRLRRTQIMRTVRSAEEFGTDD